MREITPHLRSWASDVDSQTIEQALKSSRLPILAGPVALMPDAHLGIGATIGSVIDRDRQVERAVRSLPGPVAEELLHALMLPPDERAKLIARIHADVATRSFAELPIDLEEDRTLALVWLPRARSPFSSSDGSGRDRNRLNQAMTAHQTAGEAGSRTERKGSNPA